ncbi:MAG: cysteine desulfurase [Firmicutes bacterium]|nr:cysteine desulfurase [Bacillota bacterium]
MNKVYMDFAATTFTSAEVLQSMLPYFTTEFGNAASQHGFGQSAERAVARAREQIATAIGAHPSEIYFTSGATEANNWIINGVVRRSASKRVLISAIEHPSIYETVAHLKREGFTVEYINVDRDGIISVSDLIHKLSKPCALVSVMTANNEVGTVQYINTISQICEQRGVPFHTDATQAIGSVYINVKEMSIDALSLSSHKLYGPKGIGALYVRNGLQVDKLLHGGHQERNRRGGTQNVPAIVGFGTAVEVAMRDSSVNNARVKQLREYMINQIETRIKNVTLNGHRTQRLPGNVNFSFKGIEGESILMMLDLAGIAVSTGSACSSGTLERSYVLEAMGVMPELNNGSIRFSIGRSTTKDEIDYTVGELESIVKRLRSMSPLKSS